MEVKRTQTQFRLVDMALLERSPHVEKVSPTRIHFTPGFKVLAYQELSAGKCVYDIFEENGLSVTLIGRSRINSFAYQLKKKMEKDGNFEDGRSGNCRKPKAPPGPDATIEEQLVELQNKVAVLGETVELLKKNREAELRAQKEWMSRQKQQRGTK